METSAYCGTPQYFAEEISQWGHIAVMDGLCYPQHAGPQHAPLCIIPLFQEYLLGAQNSKAFQVLSEASGVLLNHASSFLTKPEVLFKDTPQASVDCWSDSDSHVGSHLPTEWSQSRRRQDGRWRWQWWEHAWHGAWDFCPPYTSEDHLWHFPYLFSLKEKGNEISVLGRAHF